MGGVMLMTKVYNNLNNVYKCWLNYELNTDPNVAQEYKKYCSNILLKEDSPIIMTAMNELKLAINTIFHIEPEISKEAPNSSHILISTLKQIKDMELDD